MFNFNLLYFTLILYKKEFLFQDEYLKEIVGLLIPFDERGGNYNFSKIKTSNLLII